MVLRCKCIENGKVCNKEFMGARAKQSIRAHIRGAHLINVPDVLKSEYVHTVDIDNVKEESTQTVVNTVIMENKEVIPGTKNEYELISEVLEKKCDPEFAKALIQAKKNGYVAINLKTLHMKKE